MTHLAHCAAAGCPEPHQLLSICVPLLTLSAWLGIAHLLTRDARRHAVASLGGTLLLLGWWLSMLFSPQSVLRLIVGTTEFAGAALAVAGLLLLLVPPKWRRAADSPQEDDEETPSPPTDRLAALEARSAAMESCLRWTMAAAVAAVASRTVLLLSKGQAQWNVFCELLEGTELPRMTVLFASRCRELGIGCGTLGALTLLLLLFRPGKLWTLPLSVAVAAVLLVIGEVAAYAWQQPLFTIIEELGG